VRNNTSIVTIDSVDGKQITIAIDPGHGGRDPGAIGKSGLKEKDLTLDVSKRLANLLEKDGYKVHLTRDEDCDYGDAYETGQSTKKRRDLLTRLSGIQKCGADLLISIHANSFPDPVWFGAQTFYYGEREDDKKLATAIQDRLVRELGPNTRTAKSGDIFILRNCQVPSVTVELGFLSNPREESLMIEDEYRSRLAIGIRHGIHDYLNPNIQEPVGAEESYETMGTGEKSESPQMKLSDDEVVLYFAGPTNIDDLVPEVRSIKGIRTSMTSRKLVELVLQELIIGPGKGSVLESTLPRNLQIKSVDVRNQVVYLDLSGSNLQSLAVGGGTEELALFSIVNSLTELDGVSAVKFSIDGNDEITLGGHIMLDEPFGRRASLITDDTGLHGGSQ
jgi:N-acetylmuramoyl-L-alanine amidase